MQIPRDNNRRLRGFARQLRHNSSEAERKLWTILRSRQLENFKFRRQHPMAGFILDYYCSSARLAIELDGSQHADPTVVKYDEQRTKILTEIGIKIIRFSNHELLIDSDTVTAEIYRSLIESKPSPRPSPRVLGEGEIPGN